MKKLTFLFAMLIMIAAIISCSKDSTNDNELDLLKKATAITQPTASLPKSEGGTTPYLIPGANPGGNRTCAEVATAWKLDTNPFLCGEKIDYSYGAFAGEFPAGLSVTTDGKYVSFNMEDCILIGDKYYKVGAVIVKGSNAANVYYYPGGTMGDSGLASPLNPSGNPAGLSNLTFCFIECEKNSSDLIVVLKTYMQSPSGQTYAVTIGEGSENNSLHIGYLHYFYNDLNIHKIYDGGLANLPVGTLTVTDYIDINDGKHYMMVIINADQVGWLFMGSHLYVGTVENYNNNYIYTFEGVNYTRFEIFPFFEDELLPTRTFVISFEDIIE